MTIENAIVIGCCHSVHCLELEYDYWTRSMGRIEAIPSAWASHVNVSCIFKIREER